VFGWRREARRALAAAADAPVAFVPAVVDPPPPEPPPATRPRLGRSRRRGPPAAIELEVAGVVVRVGQDASEGQIAAVIRALKAGA
jgi:hypothetical protein